MPGDQDTRSKRGNLLQEYSLEEYYCAVQTLRKKMPWEKPPPSVVWHAINAYLKVAYDGAPPPAVGSRLAILKSSVDEGFYQCEAFERDSKLKPSLFALRLGNRFYLHAKLVIERAPDGHGAQFRADSHDGHCSPDPSSPDYPGFQALLEQNQRIALAIETSWAEQGLPTFRHSFRQAVKLRVIGSR